jgi:hypothetical protein
MGQKPTAASPRDPAAAETEIIVVKDDCLTGSNGALWGGEDDARLPILQRLDACGDIGLT